MLTRYQSAIRDLTDRLRGPLGVSRLDSGPLLSYLSECLTGLQRRINVPETGAFLDLALVDQPLIGGFSPRIGEQHLRVVAIQGYPSTTVPGALLRE